MIPPHVLELSAFCLESGIDVFYASPGSRSAPLLLALHRAGIHIEMLADERSMAFRAMGYSLASGKVVGIFCTSGTAVLNLGPAIAEAFYQQAKLFILTADRPAELIDQHEGQSIRQTGIFSAHTVFSASIPSTDQHPAALIHTRRLLNQALYACLAPSGGPVHLNFPFREPFYPESAEEFKPIENKKVAVNVIRPEARLPREELSFLIERWNAAPKRLLIAGQMQSDHALSNACKALSEYAFCPVLGDASHNLRGPHGLVLHSDHFQDGFLGSEECRADIILSIGKGHVSKSLKKYLAENPGTEHWHIQEEGYPADPFGNLSKVINAKPEWLITKLAEASCFSPVENNSISKSWFERWIQAEAEITSRLPNLIPEIQWSDLSVTAKFLEILPDQAILFLGNSMPIRYALWLSGISNGKQLDIYTNRGTSGIDGCLSTAIGIADAHPKKKVFVLIGDMGFLYDRNAFWTNRIPGNLKVLVLNNGGGNIFRILPSSSGLPEMADYFEMDQRQTTEGTCLDAGIMRFTAKNEFKFESVLPEYFNHIGTSVLEVFTDKEVNHSEIQKFRSRIRQANGK